jgi:deoxyribose-phosphate aldolase
MTEAELLNIARMIDHTLLKPGATEAQIDQLCAEAREYSFVAVCVNPTYVARCSRQLEGTPVKVCAVVGFPLGANLTQVKRYEAEKAIQDGATEIDMVINIGALKSGHSEMVKDEIAQISSTCHDGGAVCKVIIEAALLSDEEKVLACRLAVKAGADYVKTSTGFGPGGARVADVALMRQTVGPEMGVKAAGGIRSFEDARRMIEAGATRIGVSAGTKIVDEARDLER